MITPPFDATAIASSHSSLTGLMAGFALAALFLLIEHTRRKNTLLQKQLSRAMLLLFIASLAGTLSSFLYSSIVGITEVRAYFDFVITAPAFAITALLLIAGVNEVFSIFGSVDIITLARRISYFVIVFSVLRVWQDLSLAADIFDLGTQIQIILVVVSIVPFVAAAATIASQSEPLLQWITRRSFTAFCYVSVLISFGIAFVMAAHNTIPETQLRLPGAEAILLMTGLSCLGSWTMLLLSHKYTPINEN